VRKVFEDGERPFNHRGIARGNLQLVDRFVEAGVRVDVCAEAHTQRLHEVRDVLLREMQRAVEGHVLDKVREPALILVFEHRPCFDDEPKLGARLRQLVLPDVIAQTVRQGAHRDQRVDRDNLGERGVLNADSNARLLGAGKADGRRNDKNWKEQPEAGANSHKGIVLQSDAEPFDAL
jgi:hypothetical protein